MGAIENFSKKHEPLGKTICVDMFILSPYETSRPEFTFAVKKWEKGIWRWKAQYVTFFWAFSDRGMRIHKETMNLDDFDTERDAILACWDAIMSNMHNWMKIFGMTEDNLKKHVMFYLLTGSKAPAGWDIPDEIFA